MKHILKNLALLAVPVLCWLAFFVAFEPNDYFGLRHASSSTAPIARIRAYQNEPGSRLIIGDSRLAHFDMALADKSSGQSWQNLAFGGASLRESLDLAEYCLDRGGVDELVLGLSFYTLNQSYDTDRMAALQDTLENPLAYCFNLEYNVNALTGFNNWVLWRRQYAAGQTADTWAEAQTENETGSWQHPADYTDPDTGAVYDVHTKLAVYPALIAQKCSGWALHTEQLERLFALARRCDAENVKLTVVFPPMSENVRALCDETDISGAMPAVFEALHTAGLAVLDYEWDTAIDPWYTQTALYNVPASQNDTVFFDGFHLDTTNGLPGWTRVLFATLGGQSEWIELDTPEILVFGDAQKAG